MTLIKLIKVILMTEGS